MKIHRPIRAAKIPSSRLNHLSVFTYLTLFCFLLPGQVLALDLDPVLGGSWSPSFPPGPAVAVAIQNGYAFVAVGSAGLAIIDVSNPSNPQRVGGYDTSGYASGVAVSGNYAYVAERLWTGSNYVGSLQVIDVRNPANPQRVGGTVTGGSAIGVAVSGNYAYVADGTNGLQVIDVGNPANPQRVGGTSGLARGVAVSGNYAYTVWTGSNYVGRLQVIDVRNPANPQRVGAYDTSGEALGVAVSGNYAYVADGSAGLQVIDISNPANPQRLGGHDTSVRARDVAVSGNYAYVVGGDVTASLPAGVAVSGNYAWMEIIDISNPANPQRVGGYYTTGAGLANGVAVSGNYAYVADYPVGLRVIEITPANPQRVGGYDQRVCFGRGGVGQLCLCRVELVRHNLLLVLFP
jgi:hypothetical protein